MSTPANTTPVMSGVLNIELVIDDVVQGDSAQPPLCKNVSFYKVPTLGAFPAADPRGHADFSHSCCYSEGLGCAYSQEIRAVEQVGGRLYCVFDGEDHAQRTLHDHGLDEH